MARLKDLVYALSGKIEIRFWDGRHHVFMGKCNSRQELLKSKAYEHIMILCSFAFEMPINIT